MKKIFTNDKFFLATVIGTIIGNTFYALTKIIRNPDTSAVYFPILLGVLCTFFVFLSYRTHDKNVTKGLMGAELMSMVITAYSLFSACTQTIDEDFAGINLVLTLLLFVNHFLINADHKASPLNITLNQLLCILIGADIIAWNIYQLPAGINPVEEAALILYAVGTASMCISIVCVESRLDAYRRDREAAGWTEEKGYPENYTHEYEKKKKK